MMLQSRNHHLRSIQSKQLVAQINVPIIKEQTMSQFPFLNCKTNDYAKALRKQFGANQRHNPHGKRP